MENYVFKYLIILSLFMVACQPKIEQNNYPEIIKKHNLEFLFNKAKWELYKLNSSPHYEKVDFVVKVDEEVFNSIYEYDSILKETRFNQDIASNFDSLQTMFPERSKYYVECDLTFFEYEPNLNGISIFNGDTISLAFFPELDSFYFEKLQGDLSHTINFLNDTVIQVGINDRYFYGITESDLLKEEDTFLEYLNNKKPILNKWLLKELEKRTNN